MPPDRDYPIVTSSIESAEDLPELRRRVRDVGELIGLSSSATTRLITAVSEAVRDAMDLGPTRVRFCYREPHLVVNLRPARDGQAPWDATLGKVASLVDEAGVEEAGQLALAVARPRAAGPFSAQDVAAMGEELRRRSSSTPARERERQHRELLSTLSALRRAEKIAQDTAREQEELLGLVPAIVWMARPGGGWSFVSQRWAERTSQPVEDALGQGWMSCVLEPPAADHRDRWQSAIEGGEPFSWELLLRSGSGEARWHRLRGLPIESAGSIEKWLGVLVDVHDSRKREEQADRVATFMKRMIGIVGHDLRAPLSVITAGTAALRLTNPDIDERVVDRLDRSAVRASKMITALLDYTRAELGGEIPVTLEPIDLRPPLDELVDQTRSAHPEVTLVFDGDERLDLIADGERVIQAVGNLLENAAAHADPSRPITLSARRRDDEIVLEVHNHGEPVPEDLLPRIFEPFEGRKTGKRRGLGLGLYIVAAVARGHDGRASITSDPDEGTRATVVLPIAGPTVASRPSR